MQIPREEIQRKLLHLIALLMPIGILYGPGWSFPPLFMPIVLFLLFAVSMIVEIFRFRNPFIQKLVLSTFGSMMRKEELCSKISGSTWVIGAAFLCCILFKGHRSISFIALTLFIVGDAAAAIVGIRFGRIKIGKKSLEGSIACFIVCIVLFYWAFPAIPGILDAWGGRATLISTVAVSTVITVFELIPLRFSPSLTINDNIAVPVIAGYTMMLLERLQLLG
jgi:dolichol kinase